MHAAACEATGGGVTRLEIDRLYGGALLARAFPFVVPASEYAGRLSGFDTRGSDLIYLATDLGPFLLTLFPGVWALRRAARARRAALFGAALPFALAPFLSLSGDAYEIGSILVTRLPPWTAPAMRGAAARGRPGEEDQPAGRRAGRPLGGRPPRHAARGGLGLPDLRPGQRRGPRPGPQGPVTEAVSFSQSESGASSRDRQAAVRADEDRVLDHPHLAAAHRLKLLLQAGSEAADQPGAAGEDDVVADPLLVLGLAPGRAGRASTPSSAAGCSRTPAASPG